MSESERVQRWRQRQRQAGKEPLPIWLTSAEKLGLEDQALTQRCSPSELVQHALALLRGESTPVTDTVTDTEQIRALGQHEFALAHDVTDTVTDTVTVTAQQMLPALVRALLQEQRPGRVSATVTDTVTDTSTDPREDSRPETAPALVADTATVTVTDTTAAPTAKRKAPLRQRPVTDTVAATVTDTDPALEPFDTAEYVLGKLCPRGHTWGSTGQSLLRRTNRHCCACDREKFHERKQAKRQQKERV